MLWWNTRCQQCWPSISNTHSGGASTKWKKNKPSTSNNLVRLYIMRCDKFPNVALAKRKYLLLLPLRLHEWRGNGEKHEHFPRDWLVSGVIFLYDIFSWKIHGFICILLPALCRFIKSALVWLMDEFFFGVDSWIPWKVCVERCIPGYLPTEYYSFFFLGAFTFFVAVVGERVASNLVIKRTSLKLKKPQNACWRHCHHIHL